MKFLCCISFPQPPTSIFSNHLKNALIIIVTTNIIFSVLLLCTLLVFQNQLDIWTFRAMMFQIIYRTLLSGAFLLAALKLKARWCKSLYLCETMKFFNEFGFYLFFGAKVIYYYFEWRFVWYIYLAIIVYMIILALFFGFFYVYCLYSYTYYLVNDECDALTHQAYLANKIAMSDSLSETKTLSILDNSKGTELNKIEEDNYDKINNKSI